MRFLRRLHPLDIALGLVAIAALSYLAVTLPGYRWERGIAGAHLRLEPVALTLEVPSPTFGRLARELVPGALTVETPRGPRGIRIVRVTEPAGGAAAGTLLELELTASVDGSDRAFFADQRLRRGESFSFATSELKVAGILVEVARRPQADRQR